MKANFFPFSEHGYPPHDGILIARPDTIAECKAAMVKFVCASMEGWVSYLNNPAPGNALIKQDNSKMTDDLFTWGVTQIRGYHLIDGGDVVSQDWGTMADAYRQKIRDLMVSVGLSTAVIDWKQAYTIEFVQAMQVKS